MSGGPALIDARDGARRYAALDILRALAALGVVGVHVYALNGVRQLGNRHLPTLLAAQGATGVWLFFVLSGFVISRPFVAGLVRGSLPDVGRYAKRRVLRIYPLFLLSLVGVILFTHNWAEVSTGSKLANAFLVLNLIPAQETGNILSVWWTLGVEVCFYAFVPLAAWAVLRAARGAVSPARLAAGVAAMWVLSATWAVAASMLHQDLTTIWLSRVFPATLCSFSPGILLAIAEQGDVCSARRRARLESVARRATVMLPLALCFAAVGAWLGTDVAHPAVATFSIQCYAVAYGLLVTWALRVRVPDRRLTRVGVWLGTVSYGIYVWHALILGVVLEHRTLLPFTAGWYLRFGYWYPIADHPSFLVAVFRYVWIVGVTLVVASASWYLVESRLVRWSHRRPQALATPIT